MQTFVRGDERRSLTVNLQDGPNSLSEVLGLQGQLGGRPGALLVAWGQALGRNPGFCFSRAAWRTMWSTKLVFKHMMVKKPMIKWSNITLLTVL